MGRAILAWGARTTAGLIRTWLTHAGGMHLGTMLSALFRILGRPAQRDGPAHGRGLNIIHILVLQQTYHLVAHALTRPWERGDTTF